MLFNSYFFIFCYLPVVFTVYYFFVLNSRLVCAKVFLAMASIYFYGFFNASYVILLTLSIAFNFTVGHVIIGSKHSHRKRLIMIFGICCNLLLLGYYKYWNFFLDNLALVGIDVTWPAIILPIGISFFTFTQIAYLVDAQQDKVSEHGLVDYVLFVTFFPHLIAGPILHHSEMMPQFTRRRQNFRYSNIAVGTTIFVAGLFKKVVIADSLAVFATPVFAGADAGLPVTTVEAWTAAVAYTQQIYFDFSGYSDMAIGLARLFGIRFPLNFFSPHKAANIIDFWRRWHMTLSRFLLHYVYIPLGGNRRGKTRGAINLFLTMLIAGIWHGAGWTYVIWGAMHGVYLIVNRSWLGFRQAVAARRGRPLPQIPLPIAVLITFICVVFSRVVFRAGTVDGAMIMVQAMLFQGPTFPGDVEAYTGGAAALLKDLGVSFGASQFVPLRDWGMMVATIAASLLLVWFVPNVEQIVGRYRPTCSNMYWNEQHHWRTWLRWRVNTLGATVTAVALGISVLCLNRTSEFIYFQF
ncbi:MAG: MBOAT family protein [Defluviicoccus sp.]|nr:MBOAT family protein [Defluviicoccus sp.]MDG4592513.1 MBOAT family protein [Defluviicoccus sp.]